MIKEKLKFEEKTAIIEADWITKLKETAAREVNQIKKRLKERKTNTTKQTVLEGVMINSQITNEIMMKIHIVNEKVHKEERDKRTEREEDERNEEEEKRVYEKTRENIKQKELIECDEDSEMMHNGS